MSNFYKLKTSEEIALEVANKFKKLRKRKKITQERLSDLTGVSYASIKRFEQTGEISFTSLISLTRVINELDYFEKMFSETRYETIGDVLNDR